MVNFLGRSETTAMEVRKMSSILSRGSSKMVTLDELKAYPEPESLGSRHKPIHPHTVFERVVDTINDSGRVVTATQIAVNPKGTRFFGTVDLEPTEDDTKAGHGASVGIITATDESAALSLAAGGRVFVCSNLMATGDMFTMKKRHTTHLDLDGEIRVMVEQAFEKIDDRYSIIERQDGIKLGLDDGLSILGLALVREVLPAATVRSAGDLWMDAEYEDLAPRSVWGLHNAFTRQIQTLRPARQLNAAIDVGRFFNEVTENFVPITA